MDGKKGFLDYLGTLVLLFGVCMLILAALTCAVGDQARAVSTMFALGSAGIPMEVAFEYLGLLALISVFRMVFFRDGVIPSMPMAARVLCMGAACMGATAAFIAVFGWFPVNMWQPWVMTLGCFCVCFAAAAAITRMKERSDTRRLQEALLRMQREEEKDAKHD